MNKTRPTNRQWPLALHEIIGNIEKRTRNCLEGCLPDQAFLDRIVLDVDNTTQIMRASARESFVAQAQFYRLQPGFCRQWLEEAVGETVKRTLYSIPLRFNFNRRYSEASSAIRRELEAELNSILEAGSLFTAGAPEPDRPQPQDVSDPLSDGAGLCKKRRGRPAKISLEAKRRALEAKKQGAPGKEVAQALYETHYPTVRQVKDAPIILNNYARAIERTKKG